MAQNSYHGAGKVWIETQSNTEIEMLMGGCIATVSKLKHSLLECRGRLTGVRSQQNLQDSRNSWNLQDSGSS